MKNWKRATLIVAMAAMLLLVSLPVVGAQGYDNVRFLRVLVAMIVDGDLTIGDDLTVVDDAEIGDTLDVNGDIDLDGDGFDVNVTSGFSIDADAASNINVAGAGIDLTLESEAGSIVIKGDEAAATAITLDANDAAGTGVTIAVGSTGGLNIGGGLTNIGAGTFSTANGDNDLGVDGDLEVNGATDLDGALSVAGTITVSSGLVGSLNTESVMFPTVLSVPITYTAAAGGTGTVATVADGEIWIVHRVFVNVTEDFAATGDDATLVIGDGNDADGFLVLADAELQAADTEGTGFAAGWQGMAAATIGAYLDGLNGFIYAPSGAAETIDWAVDEGDGETLSAGAATIYVVYTRIQ